MKTKLFTTATLIISAFQFFSLSAFAQGSLTPPGAPAPTMKTLDEVEPRINIQRTISPLPTDANYHYIISTPGSYYLSANLGVTKPNGIHVTGPGVTIDLSGFQVSRSSGSGGEGITIDGAAHRCTVKNGSLIGFGYGVHCPPAGGEVARGGAFLGLVASGNLQYGLFAGLGWRIEDCQAHDNSGSGIFAEKGSTLVNCTAVYNTPGNAGYGIYVNDGCALQNCTASTNTVFAGIAATDGSTLNNCTASRNISTHGISTGLGVTLINCTADGNQGTFGFFVDAGSTVSHCTASGNTSAATASGGIQTLAGCTIIACTANSNTSTNATPTGNTGAGISCPQGDSKVQDCSASFNKGDGIRASNDCSILANVCSHNGNGGDGAGVHVTNRYNRIEGNNVSDNDRGIDVGSFANLIIKNSAANNGASGVGNYTIVANNVFGVIVDRTAPGSALVAGTSAPSSAGNTDPWANFSY